MKFLDKVHGGYVHRRRVRVLVDFFASVLPRDLSILDVGCGDGLLAQKLMEARPDLKITGADVLEREDCVISMTSFDGAKLPFRNGTFDATLLVDVLHHASEPSALLREAARVSKGIIAIKDHHRDGVFSGATLRFMDRVGNSRHGVVLPFHYLSGREWGELFECLGLEVVTRNEKMPLYPWPASLVFTRKLHFGAVLSTKEKSEVEAPASP